MFVCGIALRRYASLEEGSRNYNAECPNRCIYLLPCIILNQATAPSALLANSGNVAQWTQTATKGSSFQIRESFLREAMLCQPHQQCETCRLYMTSNASIVVISLWTISSSIYMISWRRKLILAMMVANCIIDSSTWQYVIQSTGKWSKLPAGTLTGRTFREPLFAKHISNCTAVIFVPAKDATRWNGNTNSLSSTFWDGLTSSECWWRLCPVQGSLGQQSFFQSHPWIHGGSNLCASLWNPATL